MNPPNEPSGSGPLHSWLRRLRSYVMSLKLQSGRGYRVKRGPTGTTLEIDSHGGGGGAAQRLVLEACGPDYLRCVTWDGTSYGTEPVYVAKPQKLGQIYNTVLTLDAIPVTYTYATVADNLDYKRTAVSADVTEVQYVAPRYLGDDYIYAIPSATDSVWTTVAGTVTTTGLAALLDLNVDARAWVAE